MSARPYDVFDCYCADYAPVFSTPHRWLASMVATVLTWLSCGGFYDFDNLGPDAQPAWLNEGERIASTRQIGEV